MNDEEIKKLYKRAKYYAGKKGYEFEAEDFAQEVIIYALDNEIVNLKWRFADFLRRQHGSSRAHCGRIKQSETLRGVSFDAPTDSANEDSPTLHSLIGDSRFGPEELGLGRKRTQYFTGRKGLIYDLWADHEMNHKEISEIMGVSAGRIAQIINPLKMELEAENIYEKYSESETYSSLEIEWIKI